MKIGDTPRRITKRDLRPFEVTKPRTATDRLWKDSRGRHRGWRQERSLCRQFERKLKVKRYPIDAPCFGVLDAQRAVLNIDVAPSDAPQLATTKTGVVRERVPQGASVMSCDVEESLEFLACELASLSPPVKFRIVSFDAASKVCKLCAPFAREPLRESDCKCAKIVGGCG